MEIRTESVEIPVADGTTMGGYVARPEGNETLPAVIVYMEIFGVNGHIKDVTERVAREGYVALAPDVFHRTAPGLDIGYEEDDMAEGIEHMGQLALDQMLADANAALGYLRERSDVRGDRVGAIGFCMGGHFTYLTACETDIQAAASFYGGGIAAPQAPGGAASTVSRTPKIRGQIHCYFGGKDMMIPQSQVEQIEAALKDAGIRHEVKVYADADHGFNCDRRATYHEASAKDAWKDAMGLFAEALKG